VKDISLSLNSQRRTGEILKSLTINKMYIYNIGYHTYEENEYVQLYHKKKFSKKEFENIIIQITKNILKNKTKKEHLCFQDILPEVIEELIKEFDFKEIKFDAEFNVFGWADIFDKMDWENDRDEQLNRFTEGIKRGEK